MSPDSSEEGNARRYGGVNGNDITLTEKRTGSDNKVIEFTLRNNDSLLRIQLNLFIFCLTLFIGNLANSLTLVTLSVVALALHCRHITASVDFDTLLVVESVGIQISSKKIFAGFNSSQFLPWTTVEDVFINEVITGGIETFEEMPGIHLRGVGYSDKAGALLTRRTLNVPGSYWLAHKQSIYKFTFKYEESVRETEEFHYKDELMKVIKRIIKCQSSQGQLSTLHLSISCKHTFWTRQDKMFAKLEFCNRDGATIFPQAFILTISIVDNPRSQIPEKAIKAEPSRNYEDSGTVLPSTISPSLLKTELSSEIVPDRPKDDEESKGIFGPSNSQTDTFIFQESNKSTDPDVFLNISKPLSCTTPRWRRKRRKRRDTWTSSREIIVMDRCAVDGVLPIIIVTNGQKASSGGLSDDSVCSSSQNQTVTIEDKGGKEEEKHEARTNLEPLLSRSSDITDQVMEGLMFTIKQDDDNVKVVEQRTKMELDEVLENSEKVETKEGERCLVNSSLLRLENLVTKIETQNKRIKDSKTDHPTPLIDSLASLSPYSLPEPAIEEQTNSHVWLRNSLKVRDQISTKLFPSTYTLGPTDLANLDVENSGQGDASPFYQNLNDQRKRKFVSEHKYTGDWRKPSEIGKKTKEENLHRSNANDPTNNDKNDDHDNDDDNNNKVTSNNDISNNITDSEVSIDMWKLLQDITRGAKVMVERISDIDILHATRPAMISVAAATRKTRRTLPRSRK